MDAKFHVSTKTFATLTKLSEQTILEMLSCKNIYFKPETEEILCKIDNQYSIILDHTFTHKNHSEYSIIVKNTIIEISNTECPALMFFKTEGWKETLEDSAYFTEKLAAMVLLNDYSKILIGDEESLNRLGEQFSEEYAIISIDRVGL